MPVIGHAALQQLVAGIYAAKGLAATDAQVVARHQVEANLVGHDSHGVLLTGQYVRQIDAGEINIAAELEIEAESPGTAVFGGNWGFGYVITEQAMAVLTDKARAAGLASGVIRYQGHMGRLGGYAEAAARDGLIALMTADSGRGPKAVAPFGGRTSRLGTNPICIAVPAGAHPPVVLDMATSSVAVGKLALARARGEHVAEGLILDTDGNPTTSPADYFAGGTILPLGGPQGYKGFGLSFIVEILSGLLTGLGYGVAADGRHNDGSFIALFDVQQFRAVADFRRDVDEFIDYIHASPLAPSVTEVLYPGELEARTRARRREAGIEVEDATWAGLTGLADGLGVPVPSATPATEHADTIGAGQHGDK
jgi:LDH2 family malate/lactate/ureidoglycolate dehydrogenase